MPVRPSDSFLRWVQTCIRVALNQTKNGLSCLTERSMKFVACARDFHVDRGHAVSRQRTRILDLLLADSPPFRVDRRVVDVRGRAVEHSPRSVLLFEFRVLG